MKHKTSIGQRIRGWFPKEYTFALTQKMPKPSWWKPFWALSALGIVVAAVVTVLLLKIPIERAIPELGFAFACLGIAYYIRVRPSTSINRAVYVLIGITPIGWAYFGSLPSARSSTDMSALTPHF